MLAKRHHQAVAGAIKEEVLAAIDQYQIGLIGDDSFKHVGERLQSLVTSLCKYFAWDNPKFDRELFVQETGVDLEGEYELV